MKIGIDARLIHETGVGRYIRNLLDQLQELDGDNQYIIYLPKSSYDDFVLPNARWEKRLVTVRWHTLTEQLILPFVFLKDRLDLLHVPYFNVPIFYPGRFIATIHDLIILHVMTGKATTLPYPMYLIRKIGYYLILYIGLKRAQSIIVPSSTVKKEIIKHFQIPEDRIHVTYEGVDEKIHSPQSHVLQMDPPVHPYFLYVGNAYPHKNLERLMRAFSYFHSSHLKYRQYKLILVGTHDYFYTKLQQYVQTLDIQEYVEFRGLVEDSTLTMLYKHASALIFPSLMEGFGLPAIESLSVGTPVICSDIPIFHEILGDIPTYVDPYDEKSIAQGMISLLSNKQSPIQAKRTAFESIAKKYSWKKLGIQTKDLYQQSAKQ